MNRSFINLIVESYISDNDLEIEKIDSAAQTIIKFMEDIKENDYELYNFIHEMPKSKQKELIYSVLNEGVSDVLRSWDTYGFITFVLAVIWAYSYIERGPDWYQGLAGFINRFKLTAAFAKKAITDKWKKADTATDMIITNNYHNCINRCEISARFTKSTIVRSLTKLYSESGFDGVRRIGFLSREKEFLSPDQLNCLTTCSLDSITSLIAKYAGLYINCVKKSDVIYADVKIYNTLDLGRLPSDISSCQELRNNYKELYDNFVYILELLYKGDHRKKNAEQEFSKWMSILERKINSIADNNYSGILNISKQYVGDSGIPNSAIKFG